MSILLAKIGFSTRVCAVQEGVQKSLRVSENSLDTILSVYKRFWGNFKKFEIFHFFNIFGNFTAYSAVWNRFLLHVTRKYQKYWYLENAQK